MKKYPIDGARARARALRGNMTEAEKRVWQLLRSHQMKGYRFRRQVPIGRYIADFVCHEARLIVEIDGGQHDRSSPREAERSGFLQDEGYRILRFWNNDVLTNLDGVHETIADELGGITPTQTLPHQGGGLLPDSSLEPDTPMNKFAAQRVPVNFVRAWCLSSKPSPLMGEGWEGVMFAAAPVQT